MDHQPDAAARREFIESALLYDFEDLVVGILEDVGISRAELARRLGVTPSRVTQLLGDDANPQLRTLGALGWALGIEFRIDAGELADRTGTPAENDPPLPAWVEKLDHARDVVANPNAHGFLLYAAIPDVDEPAATESEPTASGVFTFAA